MRRTLGTVLVLVLAAGACGEDGTDSAPPAVLEEQPSPSAAQTSRSPSAENSPGVSTFSESGVKFDYPSEWTARPESEQILPDRLAEIIGEEVVDTAPPTAAINVGPAPLNIDALQSSLTTDAFDPGSEVVERTDVDIEYADAGRVVEILYPATESRDFDLGEQMLIVLSRGNAAILRVAAPDSQWATERDTYEAIIASFELED